MVFVNACMCKEVNFKKGFIKAFKSLVISFSLIKVK